MDIIQLASTDSQLEKAKSPLPLFNPQIDQHHSSATWRRWIQYDIACVEGEVDESVDIRSLGVGHIWSDSSSESLVKGLIGAQILGMLFTS